MGEKAYIRDPNGQRGGHGKFGISEQDLEDFEQEALIAQWLEREGKSGAVELKHISSKGTARNTLLKAAISLDQPVGESEGRTFADLISGSDGRDLECGSDRDGITERLETASDHLASEIELFFDAIGASEGTRAWAKRILKSSANLANLRSLMKDDEPWEISLTDSEWEIL